MNGISPEIVARANELGALSLQGEDLVAVCAKLSPDEMDDLEDAVRPSDRSVRGHLRR
jgi:DNA mismatch repair protein MSH5